ncbi:MAG: hypothetical protein IJD43_05180 [Thermoguttaceae bacterium]|nr:hypothetical protein [Planctomycetaceae bacterium]MBQ4142852.1 hypothetical protein [Thermoguttaceae bacterium]
MAIIVTCPGCHKSFSVRDEFGGRKGPCPKCKTIITIPMPEGKVKVHGGEAFSSGGTSATGQLVLKPLKRRENIFKPKTAALIAGCTLTVFLLAWLLGGIFRTSGIAAFVGLVLVTPPLVYAPWFFLRDSEAIEDLSRSELIMRTVICSGVYLAFWTAYIFFAPALADAFGSMFSYMTWPFAAIPLLIAGGLIASFLFDLEYSDGFIHIAFYAMLTGLLFWTAGLSLSPEDAVSAQTPVSADASASMNAAGNENADAENADSDKKSKNDKKSKKNKKGKKDEPAAPPIPMKDGKPIDPRMK